MRVLGDCVIETKMHFKIENGAAVGPPPATQRCCWGSGEVSQTTKWVADAL